MVLEGTLTAIGIPVPDSAFARAARELIGEVAPAYLVNHSVRAYAWAVELARHDQLDFDQEILYVASLLHDIGLVPAYDLGGCFETDGAIEAQRFALSHDQPRDRARAIYDVIDLHMLAEAPAGSSNEVVLLNDSTGTDVTGYRYADVRAEAIQPILAAYPRLTFKRDFAAAFEDQAARKPTCRVAEMVRTGKLEAIANAPFLS
ncbi:MAG TPA: HD domain-containing protein [Candidatus Limnocylindrales bacterium]|nr:HD domain-containing protein [Candidatus Limnocylindrales bacterium]